MFKLASLDEAKGAVESLAQHRVITTNDLDDARAKVAEIFCPHKLQISRPVSDLNLRHNRKIYNDIALNFMDYGCEVQITPGELHSFYLVQIPITGGSVVTSAGETVHSDTRTATVPSATEHLEMRWLENSPHFVIYFSRAVIERKLTQLLCKEPDRPLRFQLSMDLSDPHTQTWCQLIDIMRKDAESNNVQLHPTVRSHIEDAIVTGLLTAQPNNFTGMLFSEAEPSCPRTIRKVIQLCNDTPEGITTVAEMAHHAGVSIRSLQLGFRRHVGVTPMQYLREIRLQRVRNEIRSQTNDQRSISDIAYTWGFTHLGRFATLYRQRFGELPSETKRGVTSNGVNLT
jgi:AraC-like DNA-binding protein